MRSKTHCPVCRQSLRFDKGVLRGHTGLTPVVSRKDRESFLRKESASRRASRPQTPRSVTPPAIPEGLPAPAAPGASFDMEINVFEAESAQTTVNTVRRTEKETPGRAVIRSALQDVDSWMNSI